MPPPIHYVKIVDEYLGHLKSYISANKAGHDNAATEALNAMEAIEKSLPPFAAHSLQRAAVKILEKA